MKFIIFRRGSSIVKQMLDDNNKVISESIDKPIIRAKTPDHKVTYRDDLGLYKLLDNFDKVKEKMAKGQKEVYQDGWSIREED